MSAVTAARPRAGDRRPPAAAVSDLFNRFGVPLWTVLVLGYLLLPIAVMIVFSFNDPPGRFNFVWGEPSLAAWQNPLGAQGLEDAVRLSIEIGVVSTLIATALGTMIALALTRYQFRGRGATNLFIFIPLATPEIILGASLLTLFVATAQPPLSQLTGGAFFPLGFNTILVAHVMFNISYVVVTVRARMQGFDRRLEEAAMDLGANEWSTFWRVTFPLIFPGILAAALLAFSLSIDDFIITQFTSGLDNTYPLLVWSSIRNRFPPQLHVIGTIIFVGAVALVVLSTIWQRRAERAALRVPPPRATATDA